VTRLEAIPRMETLEVISVGLPFCVFKLAAGAVLGQAGVGWVPVGLFLIALAAVDFVFNLVNLGALLTLRRRVVDACFLSFVARLLHRPTRKARWTLMDFGNSLDVLISFTLVAYMVGAGRLGALPARLLALWNVAVVFNVLGAGLGRFTESFRKLSARTETALE
jgi:hypothetical protein